MVIIAEPEVYLSTAGAFWIECALEGLETRGCFHVALTGGRTPEPLYQRLAGEGKLRGHWRRIHFWFGDERCVPPGHPDSNYLMARRTLLDRIEYGAVHRMEAELEPHAAAKLYEDELGLLEQADGMPLLDLVMLGMGKDGHVASLFPGSANLAESMRPVSAAFVDSVGGWRLSLTLPLIRKARQIMVLVTGRDKARTIADVLQTGRGDLPASAIAALPQTTWFLDGEAAGQLPKGKYDLVIPQARG